jgi:DNA-binding winged helix-turn-helix (wHTH) protein
VRGLRLGADDWITKPCHPEEVIARVQGLVRRRRRMAGRSGGKPIQAGEVEIRSDRFQAFVNGDSLGLTRREFELIELLAAGEGRVLEREDVYSRLWGYAMVRGDRSVDVFVRKLRHKLERASPDWRYIHTHFGIGYRFAAEPVTAQAGAGAESGDSADGPLDPSLADGEPLDPSLADGEPLDPPLADGEPLDPPLADGELALDERDSGDQRQLDGAQQEYELAAPAA